MSKQVIAICCSDLHLSLKPPISRANEDDWLEAQAHPLKQLKEIAEEHDAIILCAGDIFDRYNSTPELINWAIKHLPQMYAIPGQHDLPMHNLDNINRSAYWTLVETGNIVDVASLRSPYIGWGIELRGFPWGVSLDSPSTNDSTRRIKIKIALIHQYVWMKGAKHPGASEEGKLSTLSKRLKGWDVVIIGDNHLTFDAKKKGTTVFNPGALQRRHSDQMFHQPCVGLLHDDGTIKIKYLDTSADVLSEKATSTTVNNEMDIQEFLRELEELGDSELDFEAAMKHAIANVRPSVKKLILEVME